jgi:hypothetical protein
MVGGGEAPSPERRTAANDGLFVVTHGPWIAGFALATAALMFGYRR